MFCAGTQQQFIDLADRAYCASFEPEEHRTDLEVCRAEFQCVADYDDGLTASIYMAQLDLRGTTLHA